MMPAWCRALLLLLVCCAQLFDGGLADVAAREKDWTAATATYFDAPPEFRQRIPHNFGTLFTGACGFTDQPFQQYQSDESLVFPREQYAAIGAANPDYLGGVCGRCYEVRCATGLIKHDYNASSGSMYIPIMGTPFYKTAPDIKDVRGRSFPGILSDRFIGAKCWNDTGSILVRIGDTCPCNRPEAQGGRNEACCGPNPHLDLSYWAFSQLAHPLYGNMVVYYRPVDCKTQQPLSASGPKNPSGVLGGATSVVYDSGLVPGWGVTLNNATWANWTNPADGTQAGLGGSGGRVAACATLQPKLGVMSWQCFPGCRDLFTGADVRVTLRPAQSVSGNPVSSSGAAALSQLPLKAIVSRVFYNETNAVGEAICQGTPLLNSNTTASRATSESHGYVTVAFPWNEFQCEARNVTRATANRIAFLNVGSGETSVCIEALKV